MQAAVPSSAIAAGYLPAFERLDAAAHQHVGDVSAEHAAKHAPCEGNGGGPTGVFHAHVPLDLKVAGQPGGIDPGQIDAAEIAEDHAPGGSEPEQQLPLAERNLGPLPWRIALRPIGILLRRQREFGRVAINRYQTAAITRPATPMTMNIVRQPNASIRKVSNGTAMAVPSDDAQLKMPVARPRSR